MVVGVVRLMLVNFYYYVGKMITGSSLDSVLKSMFLLPVRTYVVIRYNSYSKYYCNHIYTHIHTQPSYIFSPCVFSMVL